MADLICTHPLDPLTAEEILLTSKLIKSWDGLSAPTIEWRFISITLLEPPKALILEYLAGNPTHLDRKSAVILIHVISECVIEALVNLTSQKIESFEQVKKGNQPTIAPGECFIAEEIAKCDEKVIALCHGLGIDNMDLVVGDPWSIGYSGFDPELEGKRLVQLFMYSREMTGDNHYAHPLNFVTIVDVLKRVVVRIDILPTNVNNGSASGVKSKPKFLIPRAKHNYDPKFLPHNFHRQDIKPLEITSPEGPSYSVNGNEICWQKFRFRISFNYREGLVLHNVRYKDGEIERGLFYRASLSEMVVPYGDPRPPFHRKCAFDVGDYGLGFCANSLALGCDCVGAVKYFDGVVNDVHGHPTVIKNAICLHEEDAGLLFKHTEYRTDEASVARSRTLVLSFIATVVNYEYAMYWTFSQDGSIEFKVKATGELSTNLMENEFNNPHATPIAKNVEAQFHQHLFAMRLDPMIDGVENGISTLDVESLDGDFGSDTNPFGQGFAVNENILKTTEMAKTQFSPQTSRVWKIFNPSSINPITQKPVGYNLVPLNGQRLLAKPDSFIAKRAGFAAHSIWVTNYDENEQYPAGFYVNQSKGGDGLPEWTKIEKNIDRNDIVVWHVFGVTHIPRVEDFPIMNVEPCGFVLKPCNFFDSNPALDVPPSKPSNTSCGDKKCF